jgi:AhpD family alkylhydroperoxidase
MSHARSEYNDFMAIAPDAYEIVRALGQAAAKAGIDKELLELIKLRASQINGCAFCVQFHILQGERLGIAADKLNLVVVWRETALFSARERAALAWTEALTRLNEGVRDEVYAEASAAFSEQGAGLSQFRDRLDQCLEQARCRLPLDPAGTTQRRIGQPHHGISFRCLPECRDARRLLARHALSWVSRPFRTRSRARVRGSGAHRPRSA